MKRRDFVKNATLTALGASLISPLEALAADKVTHFESDDLSPSASLSDDYALHFIAIGDWGRNGEYDQLEVGRQMGQWAATHPNNFVISVGDNFYPKGVISENDPLWHYSFENVYTAHSLQCDWFSILGNHDYLADPDAQIRYSKISRRWNMPARYYSKEVALGKGESKDKVLFVMIDTDPFLFESHKDYCAKQMDWLNTTLKNAPADVKWKIVVGHHPYYTVGPRVNNVDTLTMRAAFTKTFEDNKVDIYLSGHDHSLQHLKPEGYTHQFISGAGSELTGITKGIPYSKFEASEHGFMYFSVNANKLNVKAINVDGTVLYDTVLSK
ncbi:metallophosphoesterase [Mucilaginibacter sp. FT3.2]|uniref:metallophosphoesterase n=1 Tax=Mucilaginibacter sp. FT3.2 TaxID=2723090 RepID=UPI00161E2B04|nr:metallophosphoesterase [Mucilaginibacter sp. FT3.2]MBB6232220.1 3',5'-cyclic AMP phosphodiesterase CpdA [Mucilaginibacter sp. FT3.2]